MDKGIPYMIRMKCNRDVETIFCNFPCEENVTGMRYVYRLTRHWRR